MKKTLLVSAAFLSVAAAIPAQAATVVTCDGNCLPGVQPVNLNQANNVAVGTGTVPGDGTVQFTTSTEGGLNLSSGAAQITSATDALLNSLTFTLLGGSTFLQAAFNLQQQGPGVNTVTFTTTNAAGVTTTTTNSPVTIANAAGSNNFLVSAGQGEFLRSVTFASAAGFDRFEQLRIAAAPGSVPEPGTWALMLIGFGFLGVAMRRRKDTSVTGRIRFA